MIVQTKETQNSIEYFFFFFGGGEIGTYLAYTIIV